MKIAVSVVAPEVNAAFESRFGRAAAFLIIDTSSGERQAIANPAAQLGSGAGVRAAELLIRQGVEAVVSGAFGPKASDVLTTSDVRLYQTDASAVDDLVASLLKDDTERAE
jgi:predicted Fe-Mo cluster-binding NifX family protein